MKKALLLLLAALAALSFSGCGSIYEDEYYYETPYTGDIGPRSDSATEVRNYSMLKTALTNMIVNRTEKGELRFTNYNGSPSEDLAAACFEIKSEHPLGAYAVESLSYDTSYVVSYYMANIYIGYKRTAEELRSIVYASDLSDFDRSLAQAVDSFDDDLVIRCYDPAVNEDYVLAFLKRHYYADPVTTVLEPAAEVTGYPAEGPNRIFDIRLQYALSGQRRRPMSLALQSKLTDAAAAMTETDGPKLALELANYLTEACAAGNPASPYADTAYGALVNGNAGDKGYALAFRALCARCGIDCAVVEGSFGAMGGQAHFWNIIGLEGEHYHVDLSVFAEDPATGFLRSDDEIWGAYIWDTEAYPACAGALTYAEVAGIPAPEEPAPDAPEDDQTSATQGEADAPAPEVTPAPPGDELPPEEHPGPEEGGEALPEPPTEKIP